MQFLEASNANITLPEAQEPLFLHWGQNEPTIRQTCTRADKKKAIKQQQEEQQARWDAMVEQWLQKTGGNGPESPFVTVSYEDSNMNVGLSRTLRLLMPLTADARVCCEAALHAKGIRNRSGLCFGMCTLHAAG
jgi:hypothetical protein